ncbi:helix-turn-helix domain-containing protein [Gallibacterium salpingitidis]|uniref:helix-turn-helix domain-containing protein n=1 Tax=Gallibacterium salpingitidis TaxID=505341 RepID=UPI000825192E|nr:helix-turn-helix domain-containing protein [Gallibacterium salpingitidis]
MKRLIKTEQQYQVAMDRLLELSDIDLVEGTLEYEEFLTLSEMIKKYEDQQYPTVKTTPIRVIKFYMDQNGLAKKDMVKYLGSPSRVSEVLNGKRKLTKEMMIKLHRGLHIPYELLIEDDNDNYGDIVESSFVYSDVIRFNASKNNHVKFNVRVC